MKITILGCGAAGGVPSIGAGWGQCDPGESRNRRLRPSILVEQGNTILLVDSGPDLRAQLLEHDIRRLDGVLYTHAHADHLHGIDELREINRAMGAPLPIYASAETLREATKRFGYIFEPGEEMRNSVIYRPWLEPHCFDHEIFPVGNIAVEPFEQDHGYSQTTGFRFGDAAYSTDVRDLPEASMAKLRGLRVWVVGCLTDKPHSTHAHIDKVLGWVERLKPQRTVLTHLGPGLDFAGLRAMLPKGIEPAYDRMVLEI